MKRVQIFKPITKRSNTKPKQAVSIKHCHNDYFFLICYIGRRQEQEQLDMQIDIDESLIREREERIRQIEVSTLLTELTMQELGHYCTLK